MTHKYINRKLLIDGNVIDDSSIVERTGVYVVLAEPGAGKSDLLDFFARRLEVSRQRASIFAHDNGAPRSALVIDALDEVARINEETTNKIIVTARNTTAKTVVFSSRSYIWDEAKTKYVHECFGVQPTIIRLKPFDDNEQRSLIADYLPSINFDAFLAETSRFDLTVLLGNPQFLKLFADAFVQSGGRFTTKQQIYADAAHKLASESLDSHSNRNRATTDEIIAAGAVIFSRILLSGSPGVSTYEAENLQSYPYINTAIDDFELNDQVLNTRLFKPADKVNDHEPVHRIIAEYCAGRFIASILSTTTLNVSLERVLSLIAPNRAVRDELRGLLGWMASFGDTRTQLSIIALDPYAVIANGDQSLLSTLAKRTLLQSLVTLAKENPFFRRLDSWRSFNVPGFFTDELLPDVATVLTTDIPNSHLRHLILELLNRSSLTEKLINELRVILLEPSVGLTERLQVLECLENTLSYKNDDDFITLLKQETSSSIRLASEMIISRGLPQINNDQLSNFLLQIANLYPVDYARERSIGSRYFVRRLAANLALADLKRFIDILNSNMNCSCGEEAPHYCKCRTGRSKLTGIFLDKYMENLVGPLHPLTLKRWLTPLVFRGRISSERSASIAILEQNTPVRREIQRLMYGNLLSMENIDEAFRPYWMSLNHCGLNFRQGDELSLIEYVSANQNLALWEYFIPRHNIYSSSQSNSLRTYMRSEAKADPNLLRIWSSRTREERKQRREQKIGRGRSSRYYQKIDAQRRESDRAHLRQNIHLIEAGNHWGWLKLFSYYYLYKDDKIGEIVDDPNTVTQSLLNCLPFLEPHIPTLEALSERKGQQVAQVLLAHCIIYFQQFGDLRSISMAVLKAAKTEDVPGIIKSKVDDIRFRDELNSRLFSSKAEKLVFLDQFVKPCLLQSDGVCSQIYMLRRDSCFADVCAETAMQWLDAYPEMPIDAMNELFEIVAQIGLRDELISLIAQRAKAADGNLIRRKFWYVRYFFFLSECPESIISELFADAKSIFDVEYFAGRMSRRDHESWPQLSAEKIFLIIDRFVDEWPKVNLPDSWGSGDPEQERAYRFLSDIIYEINRDTPSSAIDVLDRILASDRFSDFHSEARSLSADAVRKNGLIGFQAPSYKEIAEHLRGSKIVSVEDMRAAIVSLLNDLQQRLIGGPTDPLDMFYSGGKRIDENSARNRIVDLLESKINSMGMSVSIEHHMSQGNRCDFTSSCIINKSEAIIVIEIKGQWNSELYTACSAQLATRYMIHPGAADQGIYLVLWYGSNELIASRRRSEISTPDGLRESLIQSMPADLRNRIDVIVLDLSR